MSVIHLFALRCHGCAEESPPAYTEEAAKERAVYEGWVQNPDRCTACADEVQPT